MKNKLAVLLYVFVVLAIVGNTVFAAVNTTINLNVSSNELKRGDTFRVTIRVSGVDSSKPVMSIAGYINYNTNVIETITYDSIVKSDNNTVTIGDEVLPVEDLTNKSISDLTNSAYFVGFNGNPSSGNQSRILIDFERGLKSDTDILTIEFKVKSNATFGEIEDAIKYELFVITAGNETSNSINKTVGIKVVDNSGGNENTNNNTNNNSNNNNNNNTNTNNNSQNNNTNSNSNTNNTNRNTNNTNTNNNTNNSNSNTNDNNNNSNNNSANNTSGNGTSNSGNKSGNSNAAKSSDNTTAKSSLPAAGSKLITIPLKIVSVAAIISFIGYRKIKENGI